LVELVKPEIVTGDRAADESAVRARKALRKAACSRMGCRSDCELGIDVKDVSSQLSVSCPLSDLGARLSAVSFEPLKDRG